MYIYYPSCNFKKNFPETAKKVAAYLSTQPDVKIAGCCHVTNGLPQEGDIIVTVCQSCMRVLSEVRADIPNISLFEFLLTRDDVDWPDYGNEEMTVQDCFRARGKHGLHEAVRECMRKMNIVPVEMEGGRDEEEFDGSFKLHAPYPQNMKEAPHYFAEYLPEHLTILPQEEWDNVYKEQAKKYTTDRVVTYCNTCYQGAKAGGADAFHLATLIFG